MVAGKIKHRKKPVDEKISWLFVMHIINHGRKICTTTAHSSTP